MSEFANCRKVRSTRIVHTCERCGDVIPAGSPAECRMGKDGGDMYSYYLCETCAGKGIEEGPMVYNKGASKVDQCAHLLYDFQQQQSNDTRWYAPGARCWACGTPLETFYHEERLYSVRCPKCLIERAAADNRPAMLIKAGNPAKACDVYLDRDKLAFESKNNTNEAVLTDILRYAEERYESGIADYIACPGRGECENPHEYGTFEFTEFCRACKLEWLEQEWDNE